MKYTVHIFIHTGGYVPYIYLTTLTSIINSVRAIPTLTYNITRWFLINNYMITTLDRENKDSTSCSLSLSEFWLSSSLLCKLGPIGSYLQIQQVLIVFTKVILPVRVRVVGIKLFLRCCRCTVTVRWWWGRHYNQFNILKIKVKNLVYSYCYSPFTDTDRKLLSCIVG